MSDGVFYASAVALGLTLLALLAMIWNLAVSAWRQRMELISVGMFALALALGGVIVALVIHCFESR